MAMDPKVLRDTTNNEARRLIIPATEGVYEFDGYLVMVEFNGQAPSPKPKAKREPEVDAEDPVPSRRREMRGYAPVRLASFGNAKVTPALHAAPLYSDGKVGEALCNRTEHRKSYRQKDHEISEVTCLRCQSHLREMGWEHFEHE